MSKFFDETMQGLLEAVEMENSNIYNFPINKRKDEFLDLLLKTEDSLRRKEILKIELL